MIYALLLIAALAHGQQFESVDAGTTTANDKPFSLIDQISVSNQGKAIYNLQNGRPTITGQPRFTKGICFDRAGTDCQTTAASSGASLVSNSSGTYYNSASTVAVVGKNTQYADNIVKAWGNFNGTTGAIRSAFNIKTVTNNGAGDYTVTFKVPFVDANYACVCTSYRSAVPNQNIICAFISQTTAAFRLGTYVGGLENTDTVFISCFGVQ